MTRRHWLALLGVLVLLGGGLATFLLTKGSDATQAAGPRAAGNAATPPAPEPLEFLPILPQEAFATNASVPVSTLPNPAARPFAFDTLAEPDWMRATDCLTAAIYYEAGTEPVEAQRAVAQVVLNRARHPSFPNSVCGAVYQGVERASGCQFAFTCNGALRILPLAEEWERAKAVAEAALKGEVFAPVGWATHYHRNTLMPRWTQRMVKLANVGALIFYRWEGNWGAPEAFQARHAGTEPAILEVGDLVHVPLTEVAPEALAEENVSATADLPAGNVTYIPPPPGAGNATFGNTIARDPPAEPEEAPPPAAYRSRLLPPLPEEKAPAPREAPRPSSRPQSRD